MDQVVFEMTQQLLQQAGFVIDEARFDREDFGSWFVCVHSNPRLRVVWDGKDGWLCVQRETSQIFSGLRVWDDLWVGRERCEQTPEIAVNKVIELSGNEKP